MLWSGMRDASCCPSLLTLQAWMGKGSRSGSCFEEPTRQQRQPAESDSIQNLLAGSAAHLLLRRTSCYQRGLEVIRMLPASAISGRHAHPINWLVVHHFWIVSGCAKVAHICGSGGCA